VPLEAVLGVPPAPRLPLEGGVGGVHGVRVSIATVGGGPVRGWCPRCPPVVEGEGYPCVCWPSSP
jgi:hypothetical protein